MECGRWCGGYGRSPTRSLAPTTRRAGSGSCRRSTQARFRRRRSSSSSTFPGVRKDAGPGQVEALLRIDGRVEPIIAQLTQQYTQNYQKSTNIESRLWHSVFDLVKAFIAAYTLALKAGYPRADNKRWRAILPWVIVRLAHYRGLDGKFRLFRYSHWIPAQWREFHELYEFARMRGWQREQLVFGVGAFAKPGVSFEQEYLKTLLLMRLDSGNFTPDQVEWVARQLEDWTPTLDADAAAVGRRAVRRRSHGLRGTAPARPRAVGRARDVPRRRAGVRAHRRAPALAARAGRAKCRSPATCRAREQRLLLMRLASLYGPDAIAQAPRAPRSQADTEVRVVVGLLSLTRAVAEIDRLPGPGAHAGRRGELRRGHADRQSACQSRNRSRGASAARRGA